MKLFLSAPNSSAVSRRRVCPANGGEVAVLKEKSPSCGCGQIYDGTFSRRLIAGDGVTVELFKAHGIVVCGESDVEKL